MTVEKFISIHDLQLVMKDFTELFNVTSIPSNLNSNTTSNQLDLFWKKVNGAAVEIDEKEQLGGTWILLHMLGEYVDLNNHLKPFFIQFFKWLSLNFWCPDCAGHFREYVGNNPIERCFLMGIYLYTFHNEVNKRLGKPIMERDKYNEIYSEHVKGVSANTKPKHGLPPGPCKGCGAKMNKPSHPPHPSHIHPSRPPTNI